MSLFDYFNRYGLALPDPQSLHGFRLRKPPKNRGELSAEEWSALHFNPDNVQLAAFVNKQSLEEARAHARAQIPMILHAAAEGKRKRSIARKIAREPRSSIDIFAAFDLLAKKKADLED